MNGIIVKELLVVVFLATTTVGTSFGQGIDLKQGEWTYIRDDGSVLNPAQTDRFVLQGKYYLNPRPGSFDNTPPLLIVTCRKGKFDRGMLNVNTILYPFGKYDTAVEVRRDAEPKARQYPLDGLGVGWYLNRSNDALLFQSDVLRSLLLGDSAQRSSFRPKKGPLTLVRELYIGTENAFRQSIVVRFDMPDDISQMIQVCGLK